MNDPELKFPKSTFIWVGVLGVAIVLIAFAGRYIPESKPEAEPVAVYNTLEFEVQCRGMIRDQLKSPATAEFENAIENDSVQTLPSGFFWPGWVDSQNSFGALIRTKFKCVWDKKTDELTTKILP